MQYTPEQWQRVPQDAIRLAEDNASETAMLRKRVTKLAGEGVLAAWLRPRERKILLAVGDWCKSAELATWRAALCDYDVAVDTTPNADYSEQGYLKFAMATRARLQHVKWARSALGDAAVLTGYRPGLIPGAPNPLIGALGSGLLGAGVGYGSGWLLEQLLPNNWDRGRLRKNLAMLGGAIGASPGLALMGANLGQGRAPWDSRVLEGHYDPVDYFRSRLDDDDKLVQASCQYKEAFESSGWQERMDVNAFNDALWNDPRVASRVPWPTRAAASGLAAAADHLGGRDAMVTPRDMARVTAGMGSGYLSGLLIGKALGALTGMPDQTQDLLKRVGLWSGVIKNVVPLAFGGG